MNGLHPKNGWFIRFICGLYKPKMADVTQKWMIWEQTMADWTQKWMICEQTMADWTQKWMICEQTMADWSQKCMIFSYFSKQWIALVEPKMDGFHPQIGWFKQITSNKLIGKNKYSSEIAPGTHNVPQLATSNMKRISFQTQLFYVPCSFTPVERVGT